MWRMVQWIVLNWPNSLLDLVDLCLDGLHSLNEAI
jgi:hypothetical protein